MADVTLTSLGKEFSHNYSSLVSKCFALRLSDIHAFFLVPQLGYPTLKDECKGNSCTWYDLHIYKHLSGLFSAACVINTWISAAVLNIRSGRSGEPADPECQ